MPQDIKIQLNNLVKEVYGIFEVDSIYLFGSYAYGNPNEESDLDICIITDNKSKRKIEMMKLIRKAIVNIQNIPIDLLIYYSDEFSERAKKQYTLESEIFHKGVKLYG